MSILDMKFFSFIGLKKKPKSPWDKYYKKRHMKINVQNESVYQYLRRHITKYEKVLQWITLERRLHISNF